MESVQFKVGDLVDCSFRGAEGKAYVYEEYTDFDDKSKKGVSIITYEGRDLGGFSFEEQQKFLSLIKHTEFIYKFTNVITLSLDFRKGIFQKVFI